MATRQEQRQASVRAVTGTNYSYNDDWIALFDGASGGTPADTTAPTLSSPTGTQTGSTTATIGVTTNEANGTLYSFVSTSATPPSGTDLKAGTGAVFANSQTITTTGAKTASATGLTASTAYYAHWLHRDAAANDSTIATSASFTTASAGATNLITYSEQFDNAAWSKSSATVTANNSTAPDATTTADLITASATTSGVSQAATMATATAHTWSVYAKAGTCTWLRMAPNGVNCWFDIGTGALGTQSGSVSNSAITDAGGGWYRCSVTWISDGIGAKTFFLRLAAGDNNTSATNATALSLWGAMVETGSSLSTYVPRTA